MTDKITVLLIEDDNTAAETTKDTITAKLPDVNVVVEGDFKQAEQRLDEVLPDMVVLDLYDDPHQAPAGNPVWEKLWKAKFCPLVFHSAHDEPGEPAVPPKHPFVKFVKKRRGSDDEVAGYLQAFLPHVRAIRGVNKEIVAVAQGVLRDVSTPIWDAQPEGPEREEILKRAARRRVAATMDLTTISGGKPMRAWEQYVLPALGTDLLTGDLLCAAGGDSKNPANYRLVLSPSCDMVTGEGRKPLANILVARCEDTKGFLRAAGFATAPPKTLRKHLPTALTRDQCGGYIPLPELPGIIPAMAAGLRELELIPLSTIGNVIGNGITYYRLASVDSPFRERIAWAYLQISGRPGMPEYDSIAFADSIVKATETPKPSP
jgi:CTP synthase